MLSEFSSAAHTSCARSYRRSIGAVMSNVDALCTAKPNRRDDMRAVTKTQARLAVVNGMGKTGVWSPKLRFLTRRWSGGVRPSLPAGRGSRCVRWAYPKAKGSSAVLRK